jgi:hypothetical protein
LIPLGQTRNPLTEIIQAPVDNSALWSLPLQVVF